MQVVGDGARRDAEEVLQAGERLLEELHRLVVLQVADVLAEDGVAALGQAEGVLQLAAEGEDLVQFDAEVDGLGDEAARAAQDALAAFEGADDGIVDAGPDVAVVEQEPVGDAVELAQGFGVGDDDGLLAEVAAGHDQRGELGAACRANR